ncbi:MAG TPA: hypothetical protein VJR95_08590 [Rhodanobacter sp.]|nr:hypothetical protein [Rhodanobacter sp.]
MIVVSGSNGQQGYRYFRPWRRQAVDEKLAATRMPSLRTMQVWAWLNLAICALPLIRSWTGLADRYAMLDEWIC